MDIKTKILSIEPLYTASHPYLIAKVHFEGIFKHEGTNLRHNAHLSVMVEKKDQSLEELRGDAIQAAVNFLKEIVSDR